MTKNYETLIQEKVKEGEAVLQKIKDELAQLAEEGRTTVYWGEYGSNGETYYSTTYVEDNIDENGDVDYISFEGQYGHEPGSWISSSERC